MARESPWLTDDQQRAWRSWLALRTALPAALNRQLQADSGLSLTDYDVLVALSESDGHRLRVGDLAGSLDWERSRVSHHVARMAKRALVVREECEDDGRGAWVGLSTSGRQAIEHAAPAHARLVRELLFEGLSEAELEVFERVLAGIGDRVAPDAGRGARSEARATSLETSAAARRT